MSLCFPGIFRTTTSHLHSVPAKVPGYHVQLETHHAHRLRVQPITVRAAVHEIRSFQLGAAAEEEPAELVPEVACEFVS